MSTHSQKRTSTDEQIIFHYYTQWKTQNRWSDWSAFEDVVVKFRELGLDERYPEAELMFYGDDTPIDKRQKTNSQKILRLINPDHVDYSESIESRYKAGIISKAIIAALPLELRIQCLQELNADYGVLIATEETGRGDGAFRNLANANLKESAEAHIANSNYLADDSLGTAKIAHKELKDQLKATISNIASIEFNHPELTKDAV